MRSIWDPSSGQNQAEQCGDLAAVGDLFPPLDERDAELDKRALIKLGIALIKNRSTFRRGRELTEAFRLILA